MSAHLRIVDGHLYSDTAVLLAQQTCKAITTYPGASFAKIAGFTTVGDGLGGDFVLVTSSDSADNDTIVPTDSAFSSFRWKRVTVDSSSAPSDPWPSQVVNDINSTSQAYDFDLKQADLWGGVVPNDGLFTFECVVNIASLNTDDPYAGSIISINSGRIEGGSLFLDSVGVGSELHRVQAGDNGSPTVVSFSISGDDIRVLVNFVNNPATNASCSVKLNMLNAIAQNQY